MAVYERTYKRYVGDLTPQWSRLLVLPRYVYQDIVKSKLFVSFLVFSLVYPLINAVFIYLRNNLQVLEAFAIQLGDFLDINEAFFNQLMFVQFQFAFFAALFMGPGLVAKDLANNGLPLYLSRPFSRVEYVLGKFLVLAGLLSVVTWIPGLGLFALQTNYAGLGWATENARLAVTVFVGSWLWIITLSLMALALSAWVKWRAVAGFMMFMAFIGGGFFQEIIALLFRSYWGSMVNLIKVHLVIWDWLLGTPPDRGLPVWAAWMSFFAFAAFFVFLLHKKIRAYEVVS